VLEKNTADLDNQQVDPRAVWSEPTALTFHDFGVAWSAFNSAFDPRLQEEVASQDLTVQATTLDLYAAEHGAPDFVKIDAESAESHVIAGMVGLLDGQRPVISVEVGDYEIDGVPTSRQMIDSVRAHDYEVAESAPHGFVRGELLDRYGYTNVLLVPSERINR
jgi:FkbM family methyltransferase